MTFFVRQTREEIALQAVRDEARGLNMLQSDAVFLFRYAIPLTPEQAQERSPGIVASPNWPNRHYWTCGFLREDMRCQLDVDKLPKPMVCRGYPGYGSSDYSGRWMYEGCGYRDTKV
ncbi:MAG: hypothetical protein ACM3PP_02065 [Candidatus Saccharibacteria bacterium]